MVNTAYAFALAVFAVNVVMLVEHTQAGPREKMTGRRCSVAGEEYREARRGCAETTCDERKDKARERSQSKRQPLCSGAELVQDCFCTPGLYRNRQKACVLPSECP
ncbi:hypothetical protein MRX96_027469 [Rhipicephalus microplus]|uniref:uncharacterized protein LOC142774729 n=1 Tax=Rhipicephalus microplus TaxID=6941 RepID=UPI003F6B9F82